MTDEPSMLFDAMLIRGAAIDEKVAFARTRLECIGNPREIDPALAQSG